MWCGCISSSSSRVIDGSDNISRIDVEDDDDTNNNSTTQFQMIWWNVDK